MYIEFAEKKMLLLAEYNTLMQYADDRHVYYADCVCELCVSSFVVVPGAGSRSSEKGTKSHGKGE